ncbi:MAG TPA: hypothetical protein VM577_02200 [Anaerovoracaceae bacterium]|nr:hypothetical protein [Anaerovoracaceae bacterium]
MTMDEILKEAIEKEKAKLLEIDGNANEGSANPLPLMYEVEANYDQILMLKDVLKKQRVALYPYLVEMYKKKGYFFGQNTPEDNARNVKLLTDYMSRVKAKRENKVERASVGKKKAMQPLGASASVGIADTPESQPESFVKVNFVGRQGEKEYFAALGVDLDNYPDLDDEMVGSPYLYADWKQKLSHVGLSKVPEEFRNTFRAIKAKFERQY